MNKNILVIVAHPDDETYGCGGTIMRHVKDQDKVWVLTLADGVSSRFGYTSKEISIRNDEFKQAAKLMGVTETISLGFKDQRLDTVPLLEITQAIEKVVEKLKPAVVYTHYRGDLNKDHRLVYQAVMTACRPIAKETVKEILCFEVPSSTEWNYPCQFFPNVYNDISLFIGQKIKVLEVYKSEAREWPHPRSLKAVEILAQKRGCESGTEGAEAFELIRKVVT